MMESFAAVFVDAPYYGQPARRVIVRFGIIWTLLAVVAMFAINAFSRSQQQDFARIAAHPATVQGVVTFTDPGDHNSFGYRYSVDTAVYSGGSYPQATEPEAATLHVGQPIRVVYDRTDPGHSCACNVSESADQNHWWQALFGGYFITSIVAAIITLQITRRRARRNPPGSIALTD